MVILPFMPEDKELIPQLFRTEYSKITLVLSKLFGFDHIEIAEDIASDTFLLASQNWAGKGIPGNPEAWLYAVAKNKAKDYLKHDTVFNGKVTSYLQQSHSSHHTIEIDLSEKNIADSQLQMMFAICHPSISAEAQVGLSLRILCGFGIEEIAYAFMSNKETINKRLFRAKETLRKEKVKIEFPRPNEIDKRLETVMTTLYLLFNEGYYSLSQNSILRKELCLEAIRLNYLLVENPSTDKPAANALLALMCFHASRFEARKSLNGEFVLYDEQDTNLWNDELIEKGTQYLNKAATGEKLSKYHLEAAIARWHTDKTDSPSKWESTLQLYNRLLLIAYSPSAALNRTYALSKADGKQIAIIEAEKLQLVNSHLYYALLGYLYTDVDNGIAMGHYETALGMAKSEGDKAAIEKNLKKLKSGYLA